MTTRKSALWPFVVAGWSGFYVMLVELLSGRLIAPFFGNNIYVWGSVIFVFMFGLAIGYLLGGLYSRKDASIVRLCVILAASALTTVPTLLFGDVLLNFVFDQVADPRTGSLVCCAILYFVPTVFAGMISPYAIRIIVQNKESSGYDAGYLYFVSTIGSSAGTLLTSFYLVLWFEVNTILMIGMGISFTLAIVGTLDALERREERSACVNWRCRNPIFTNPWRCARLFWRCCQFLRRHRIVSCRAAIRCCMRNVRSIAISASRNMARSAACCSAPAPDRAAKAARS